MRILIVEDEPTLGSQLKSTLEHNGYAVDPGKLEPMFASPGRATDQERQVWDLVARKSAG